ncbi:MAG: HAMP domain-containing histidine kinase [bacterium]|nr:HAMP domain-containing histidine kinase [bacterium]
MSRSFDNLNETAELAAETTELKMPKNRRCSNGYKGSMFAIALIFALAFFVCLGTALYGGTKYDIYGADSESDALAAAYKSVAGGMIAGMTSEAIDHDSPDRVTANGKKNIIGIVDETSLTSVAIYTAANGDEPLLVYEGDDFASDDVWLSMEVWVEVDGSDLVQEDKPLDYVYYDEEGNEIDGSGELMESNSETVMYTVECTVSAEPTMDGAILTAFKECTTLYSIRWILVGLMILFFAIALAAFIALLKSVGHRPDANGLVPGRFAKIPLDILTVAVVAITALMMFLLEAIGSHILAGSGFVSAMIGLSLFGAIVGAVVILWSMALASRIKMHTLVSGLAVTRLFRWIGRWLKRFGLIKRTVIIIAAVVIIELIAVAIFINECDMEGLVIFFVLLNVIFIVLAIGAAWSMRGLEEAREQLAAGNYDYRVDTSKMRGGLKRHGEELNAIAEGLAEAVEEGVRSERMRTELITNVSHDIKTPVTSIVNYADLLSKEETDNEKIREYTEVIGRQANRLKHLVSDLVDASKASSGTVEINLERCDLGIILSQVVGEFEFKLEDQGLQLVIDTRAENVAINADTRHLWRIFNNLMGNICKYSAPGTRVYVTLETVGDAAVITFRNTSRDPLNITADELMERFVRGDQSRSTEGSGLGLAIARSLTELQRGTFDLKIDGDLFKAILSFPTCV